MEPPLVRGQSITVLWVDITGNSDWIDTEDFERETPAIIVTRGIFISQDDKFLKIASTYYEDISQIADRNIIPLSVILNIKRDD